MRKSIQLLNKCADSYCPQANANPSCEIMQCCTSRHSLIFGCYDFTLCCHDFALGFAPLLLRNYGAVQMFNNIIILLPLVFVILPSVQNVALGCQDVALGCRDVALGCLNFVLIFTRTFAHICHFKYCFRLCIMPPEHFV